VPQLFTFEARDAATIRDGMLRVLRTGLIARGIASPNVTPGSDWYVWAQAIANELEVVEANAIIKSDAQMPDSSEGDDLYRICAIYGLSLQPAAGSSGPGTLTSSASVTIATGEELLDSAGLRYRLVTGGTFASGDSLSIEAVDTGIATNHEEDDVLRWQNTPAFANEKVLIGVGGLVNGHDAEDDEGLRARLYAVLQTPPRSGNWEHVAEIAEASSPAVQKAFVYPAVQGPATVHVAVASVTTATSKERDVTASTMSATVVPYVQGQIPEHVYVVTTTVANAPTRIAISLSIPDAPTASPPGPGGGWLDGAPWPDVGASGVGCRVTTATSSTVLIVDAVGSPTIGVSRISWLSSADWKVRSSRVIAVSGTTGAYTITLDTPLTGIVAGDHIWPACVKGQTYADAVITSFAAMGPGEKTANVTALVRGFRRPRQEVSWPYSLGPQMIRELVHSQSEIAFAQFLYRTDGTGLLAGSSGSLAPQVPGALADPPNIFTPSVIGFYRAT